MEHESGGDTVVIGALGRVPKGLVEGLEVRKVRGLSKE